MSKDYSKQEDNELAATIDNLNIVLDSVGQIAHACLQAYGCTTIDEFLSGELPDLQQLTCADCGSWRPLLHAPGVKHPICASCCIDRGIELHQKD